MLKLNIFSKQEPCPFFLCGDRISRAREKTFSDDFSDDCAIYRIQILPCVQSYFYIIVYINLS